MSLATFIFCISPMHELPEYYGFAINLTAYYAILMMMKLTYMPLLGERQDYTDPQFLRDITSCFVFPIPIWSAITYGHEDAINIILYVSDAIFFIVAAITVFNFLRLYRKAVARANSYYADDVEVQIGWLMSSAKYLISMVVVAVVAAFSVPQYLWVGCCFMFYGLWVYVYVYKSFYHFMISFSSTSATEQIAAAPVEQPENSVVVEQPQIQVVPEIVENPTQLNIDTFFMINRYITMWLNEKLYTQKGITIQSVASKVYTNRTYLSNYINTKYKCSFKVWITRLRVEEAKRLMIEDPNMNVGDIAEQVGCSSATSFNHLFKQQEGVSPVKWRSREIAKPQE